MKKIWILAALALPLFAQDSFDFKTLDKLSVHAKESTVISLDPSTLKMASGLVHGSKDPKVRSILANLKSMQIRSYEYSSEGQYKDADLEPLRNYLGSSKWSKVLDVKDKKEITTIYAAAAGPQQEGGWAIVSTEPKEVTIVLIEGNLTLDDLSELKAIPNDIRIEKDKSGKKDQPSGDK